jgi:metal-responsive CopG/Arc/MetJ family transcriptional regulator
MLYTHFSKKECSMPKKLTAIRIKEKTLEALDKIAAREDENLSELIRRILEEYVKKDAAKK